MADIFETGIDTNTLEATGSYLSLSLSLSFVQSLLRHLPGVSLLYLSPSSSPPPVSPPQCLSPSTQVVSLSLFLSSSPGRGEHASTSSSSLVSTPSDPLPMKHTPTRKRTTHPQRHFPLPCSPRSCPCPCVRHRGRNYQRRQSRQSRIDARGDGMI